MIALEEDTILALLSKRHKRYFLAKLNNEKGLVFSPLQVRKVGIMHNEILLLIEAKRSTLPN